MRKYLAVLSTSWQDGLTYRFNFVMWRFRWVLSLLLVYFLWWTIYSQSEEAFFGYSFAQMASYVLGTSLIRAIVFSSRTIDVGSEIDRGDLSLYLVRPLNYGLYWFVRDIGDKALNLFFAIFEILFLFLLLKPPVFIQQDLFSLSSFFLSLILALVLYFFINFFLALLTFWTPGAWSHRFLFFVILEFTSGGLFPLDILPEGLFHILSFLPFSSLVYVPMKIYLGELTSSEVLQSFVVQLVWILIFYVLVRVVWKKGIRNYSAEGR
ncbi:MAG TPA: ABC-2 family transporter protein [Patescibacteria group bacterium]|nr:ABC-2 family transporter protein [Patescibacteria group bacterium]